VGEGRSEKIMRKQRLISKRGHRFSEKIMRKQDRSTLVVRPASRSAVSGTKVKLDSAPAGS